MAGSKGDGSAWLAGSRVLVVEDEALPALHLASVLQDLSCTVVGPAQVLSEALALARSEPLDAAMLDLNLCGEAAWPVADALSARGVPYAILSGYGELDVGREIGAVLMVAKPVGSAQIAAALAACLNPRRRGPGI